MKRLRKVAERLQENIDKFLAAQDGSLSVLDETLVNMKKRLSVAKDLAASAMAKEEELKRNYQNALVAEREWREKTDIAFRQGKLEAAHRALRQKRICQNRATRLQQRIAAHTETVEQLKMALREFYHEFQSMVDRAESLDYRQKQADTRTRFYDVLSGFSKENASTVLEKMEQIVENLEARAETAEYMNEISRSADCRCKAEKQNPEQDTALHKTEKPKTQDTKNLDDALAELKKDILGN